MMKRKVLAAVTVAALCLFTVSVPSAPIAPAPAPSPAAHTIEQSAVPTPEWGYAFTMMGMGAGEAFGFAVAGAVVCAPFILIASIGCGIVGAA